MRTTMRVGRGLYVTGGGGVFAAAVFFMLIRSMLILLVLCVIVGGSIAVACAILAISKHLDRPKARRALAGRALAMAVPTDTVRACGPRGAPPVIGLYALGGEFLVGSHPRKWTDLERLYPNRLHDLVCVGIYPDRATANAARRALLRNGFSARELKSMSEHTR